MPTATNTAATTNQTKNVSSAKGVRGGYIYFAPLGTALPTDNSSPLGDAFKVLGYVSSDGYVEHLENSSQDFTDMNGDLIDTENTSRAESGKVTFAELKADTLKIMYGPDNVTDAGGTITVNHNGNSVAEFVYVLELVLKNRRKWRKVIPDGQSADLDDLTIAVGELAARPITIKYLTDSSGNTCYDYIDSTETTTA